MLHRFSRMELIVGEDGLEKLTKSNVAVFGVGGVGSFTAEALARAGVGAITLVDYDEVCLTNINRQLIALQSTVGKSKVEVMASRIKEINPKCEVKTFKEFYSEEKKEELLADNYNYIVDAIDTVSAKLSLVIEARRLNIPIVSAMGAGNKLDPTQFRVADISETHTCPLAKVMRTELRKRGIPSGVKVVFSTEKPIAPVKSQMDCKNNCICPGGTANCTHKRQIPGSISFVPSVSGLIIAGVVINDLLGND